MAIHANKLQMAELTFFIIGLFFTLSTCKVDSRTADSQYAEINSSKEDEFTSVKDDFYKFSNFVLDKNKIEIKKFFEFPLKSSDLWYKVLPEKEVEHHVTHAFTEQDFDKYFESLFDESFRECLLSINVDQLFDSGRVSSKPFTKKDMVYEVTTQMEAVLSNNELRLILTSIIQNNKAEFEAESTEIYIFNIIKNKLKFSSFFLAG